MDTTPWKDLRLEDYDEYTRSMMTEAERKQGRMRFDESRIIIESQNWTAYKPFLCASLGLTDTLDLLQVSSIEELALGATQEYQFSFQRDEQGCTISHHIKLTATRNAKDGKFHIAFYRSRLNECPSLTTSVPCSIMMIDPPFTLFTPNVQ
jgi:hypothetical protein